MIFPMNNKQAKVPYKLMLAEPGIFNAQDHRGDNEFLFIHLTYFQKEGEVSPLSLLATPLPHVDAK